MRKALITCAADPGEGAWYDVYKLAESTFKPYAEKHGYDYKAFWHPDFKEEEWPGLFHGRLPVWAFHPDMTQPCWMKIPAIIKSLESYDSVVYIDNDAVIVKDDRDIMDDLPPTGEEAKSQRQDTIMPLIWGLLGLILVVGFTIWLASR